MDFGPCAFLRGHRTNAKLHNAVITQDLRDNAVKHKHGTVYPLNSPPAGRRGHQNEGYEDRDKFGIGFYRA